ncbi:GNAT family N-acetyltransferase [Pseudaestuariivita rosea]|uniref:GNAT family N-acetyltransferase n=1 Tax=Pseudaestuariivita rosea TaxID=2763263 RepID=UPI001ABA2C2C|nr:GNAT family protein [Pseudaestuariivita rosea]
MIPVLHTERLILRGPVMEDFPACRDFFMSDRAAGVGGAVGETEAFRRFATLAGHWHLKGFGWWMIEEKGKPVGICGIHHPPVKEHMELGWSLFSGEGRGLAYEAALAARRYAYAVLNPEKLVSYILMDNTRSIALAERLGAVCETAPAAHNADAGVWVHPTAKELS